MIEIELILAYLTLISHIALIFILGVYLSDERKIMKYKKYFPALAFMIALFGTIGSLFYSEIMNYPPCDLCWYQRIFMYPIVLILGMGLFRNDKNSLIYSIPLSLIGLLFAGYHYAIQFINVSDSVFCDLAETSVSCTENFFTYFNYINLPGMSLTAFLIISLLLIFSRK